jgi:hypothetical protein
LKEETDYDVTIEEDFKNKQFTQIENSVANFALNNTFHPMTLTEYREYSTNTNRIHIIFKHS